VKTEADKAKGRLLRTFESVPDDKLSFSPGGEAKTALQIVEHAGGSNLFFSRWIAGTAAPNPEEAKKHQDESHVQTRIEALQLIEESHRALLASLDGISDATLEDDRESPFGVWKLRDVIYLPILHYHGHASQIDYLQTIWGDMDWHM